MTTITIIYDYFSPAYKAGGPTQSLVNLVQSFVQDNISIDIICSNKDLDGTVLDVETDKWISLPGAGQSTVRIWYASEATRNETHKLITDDSVLFINSMYAHFLDYPSLIRSSAKRKIISPRGMLDPGSIAQKPWKKIPYLLYWKLRGMHRRCEFHATSQEEEKSIRKVFGKGVKVFVVPNFPRVVEYQQPQKVRGSLNLASIALISPIKNHLLVAKALKNVQGNVVWSIYGPVKDAAYWQECEETIAGLPSRIRVQYHGDTVPEKVPEALAAANVAILPSSSENFGHSIFEAFTAGKPVITSNFTPWNKLKELKAGMNVGIGNTQELSESIDFFAQMDQEEFGTWSRSAREFALQAIDFSKIKQGYLQMFGVDDKTIKE